MSAARFKPNEGDWICPDADCGNVNFSRRNECNRCGKGKKEGSTYKKGGMEIGEAMAEKSKGLFSADDWQCKSCGNVNWARRNTCNMCNSAKYGKVEQRTGFGGGFMEREEVVEYVKREDSDDEYDEFGRLKKKKGSAPVVESKLPVNQPEEEDETEEEDEDDSDVDFSKYDLGGSDEDSIKNENQKEAAPPAQSTSSSSSSSRSPSRSRSSSRSGYSSRSNSPSNQNSSRKRSYSRSRSNSPGNADGQKRTRRRSRSP